jgi:hypothetical protein
VGEVVIVGFEERMKVFLTENAPIKELEVTALTLYCTSSVVAIPV